MRGAKINMNERTIKPEDLCGVYAEVATLLGMDAARKLHNRFRGTQVSFPVELLSREYLFEQIRGEYNGTNIRELASKYGYTEKWIRKIVKTNG